MSNDPQTRWLNPSLLPPLLYMGVIFALSSIPDDASFSGPSLLLAYPNLNNFLHIPLFGGLTWLWLNYLRQTLPDSRKAEVVCIVICLLFALSDEFHQMFVPGRFASVMDVLLDIVGILGAVWWYRRRAPDTGSASA